MIDAAGTPTKPNAEPTISDDPKLYDYQPSNAPENVVVNIGEQILMIAAPHAVNDPDRMEVGDRRRGAYYVECIGKMPGLMRLCQVDEARLAAVQKTRDIRVGLREPDWVVAQRKISADRGEKVPAPYDAGAGLTPLQRAAKGI